MIDFSIVTRTTIQVFGEPGVYTPQEGEPIPLMVVFRQPFQSVDLRRNVAFGSSNPTAFLALADLPAEPLGGDLLEVAAGWFRVIDPPQPDGKGGVLLELHEAPQQ